MVHAPSSRRRKGTDHVVRACDDLDVDLVIVEGLHEEALARYRDADIVVDQLHAGWYGLAIECMALGKPVVTFLHDEAVTRTQDRLRRAGADRQRHQRDARARLEELVDLGPTGREELGRGSRVRRARARPRPGHRPAVGLYDTVLERLRAARGGPSPTALTGDLPPALPLGDNELESTVPPERATTTTPRALAPAGLGQQLRRLGRHSVIYGIGGWCHASSRSCCSRSTPAT